MEGKPPPLATALLLGASFIGLGGLLWLWSDTPDVPVTEIIVHQRIIAPDGKLVFNGTVVVSPGNGTVEGALRRASQLSGFEVNITREFFGKSFVQSIAGYRNERACGWVYDHNGVRSPRSVDEQVLADQDQIRWSWDCVG